MDGGNDGRGGRYDGRRSSRTLNRGLQREAVGRVNDRVVCGRHDRPQEVQEFGGLDGRRVRRIDHILVPHLEGLREEISRWIAEIDVVNDRDDGTLETPAIDSELLRDLPGLAAIQEHR